MQVFKNATIVGRSQGDNNVIVVMNEETGNTGADQVQSPVVRHAARQAEPPLHSAGDTGRVAHDSCHGRDGNPMSRGR